MTTGARAAIRLAALRANFALLKNKAPGCKTIVAVKANAYGHGLSAVAPALDADCHAVARLVEAEALRALGIETPVLLFDGVRTAAELDAAVRLNCDLVVHSEAQVSLLERSRDDIERIWLKVDTGMHRLGVYPEAVENLLARLRATRRLTHIGLMTHLANADDPHDPLNRSQLERFAALTKGFDGDISIANSALLLGGTGVACDCDYWGHRGELWIRPGISLYGISPLTGHTAADLGLAPVMQFETDLVDVKTIAAGAPVGYGGTWRAPQETCIGIAAAGYGDGYPRYLPSATPVLVDGRRVPLVGTVSMDLLAVDLGRAAADVNAATVVLWGDGLPVEEVAHSGATTAYPLVTGVTGRVARPVRDA